MKGRKILTIIAAAALIADGYYFSKSMKLLQYLLQHPDLLDRPFSEKLSDEAFASLR